VRFWNWFRFTLLDIIKYAMYMRLFIEAHEAMLLSASSEIYLFELNSFPEKVSFAIAIGVLLASIALPALAFYVFWKQRNNYDPEKKFVLMEFLADLRNAKAARMYMTVLLIRRVIFIVLIIFFIEFPREFIYIVILGKEFVINFLVSQFIYVTSLLIIRPFDNIINNIIEFINEAFLFVIIGMLFSFDSAEKWTESAVDTFLLVLTYNGYVVVIVMVVGLILMIVQKCLKKKPSDENSNDQVTTNGRKSSQQNLNNANDNIYDNDYVNFIIFFSK